MKEKESSNWDQNLHIMTGRPLSICELCEEEDLKLGNVLESDKLVSREMLHRPSPNTLAIMEESFDLSVQPVVNHYQKSTPKPLKAGKHRLNKYQNSKMSKKAKNLKKREELYQKQKSVDKRAADASAVQCLCCSVNGTCVGVVGVILLIGLAIALLSVPGAGRMPETVPIFIRNYTEFINNYNDSYNYEFLVLKHIRSYMRYAFLRKADIERTYISISFQLGWLDDHLINGPGTVKLMFERLPYESFFRRDPEQNEFFKVLSRTGSTFSYKVGSAVSNVEISVPNVHLRRILEVFCKYYGFGHASVPIDMRSFQREILQTEESHENFLDLLPSRPEYTPRFVPCFSCCRDHGADITISFVDSLMIVILKFNVLIQDYVFGRKNI